MRVWNSLDEVPTDLPRTVVTLGNFDGVHRGHREVLRRVVELARARDALAVAVTFTPHPRAVHQPEVPHVDIISPEQRVVLLDEAGLDAVLLQRYTLEFADQSPEEFVRGMLVHGLHAAVVVVGHDVRFGRGNTGDVAEMVRLGARYGFEVEAVEEFPAEHGAEPERRCSSTWVREALAAGDVAQAAAVLGRHHVLAGEVVHGFARGRELGFPTANLVPDDRLVVPGHGVYAAFANGHPAAVNVGVRPTFETGRGLLIESFLIDFDGDLYGQNLRVAFVSRLRGERRFPSGEDLIAQMNRDVAEAGEILAKYEDRGKR